MPNSYCFPFQLIKTSKDFNFSFVTSVVQSIKQKFGDDVWLALMFVCAATPVMGIAGILDAEESKLLNHETVLVLSNYAKVLADAGVDCIAPSDMTDGRIAAIRKHWMKLVMTMSILSYSAKFSSQFYNTVSGCLPVIAHLQLKIGRRIKSHRSTQPMHWSPVFAMRKKGRHLDGETSRIVHRCGLRC